MKGGGPFYFWARLVNTKESLFKGFPLSPTTNISIDMISNESSRFGIEREFLQFVGCKYFRTFSNPLKNSDLGFHIKTGATEVKNLNDSDRSKVVPLEYKTNISESGLFFQIPQNLVRING